MDGAAEAASSGTEDRGWKLRAALTRDRDCGSGAVESGGTGREAGADHGGEAYELGIVEAQGFQAGDGVHQIVGVGPARADGSGDDLGLRFQAEGAVLGVVGLET